MKNLIPKAWLLLALFIAVAARAETVDPNLAGKEILSEKPLNISPGGKKGLVVVFLSAHCPCSNS
ncbi:MAG: hypothetical protein EOO01_43625, partial [Chitinophagaceae bacterium]